MATIREALLAALDHHESGRAAEAEILYARILEADPEQADALHLSGVLAAQTGRLDLAARRIGGAVALAPSAADYLANRANALRALGRHAEAARGLRRALRLRPEREDWATAAAHAARDAGDAAGEVAALAHRLRLRPGDGEVAGRLTELLARLADERRAAGRALEADAAYHRALALTPDAAATLRGRGLLYLDGGLPEVAARLLDHAARLEPDAAATRQAHAVALREAGRNAEAADAFAAFLRLDPGHPGAWLERGQLLRLLRRAEDAGEPLRKAAALRPDHADAYVDLGHVHNALAAPVPAVAAFTRAALLRSDAAAEAAAILALNLTDAPGPAIRARAEAWARRHADPLAESPTESQASGGGAWRDPDPERPLRVGYLVDNILTHDYTCLPLVEAHGPAVRPVVYAFGAEPDTAIGRRYARAAALFRPLPGIANADLAAMIRADGIDVLVDGTGFPSGGQRLLALARRPAPVQVHFPVMTTTGMAAVDAVIVDAVTVPPEGEAAFGERLLRIPIAYHFQPLMDTPDPAEPPMLGAGAVTFGSMNQLRKIGAATLAAWARVLAAVPGSRLRIKAPDMTEAGERRLRAALCGGHGIDAGRITLLPRTESLWDHYAAFNAVDILLDTIPYGGVTTTAQALWMGAPTIVLAGTRVLDRYGASILGTVGLADCVAGTVDAYVAAAVAWAGDAGRLAEVRRTARTRMRATPLADAAAFARDVEGAYRSLWRDWCAHQRRHSAR